MLEHPQIFHCQAFFLVGGGLHLWLHFLQQLNLLLKHLGRKLLFCCDTSKTGKLRSHCSWHREAPGSSKAIAHRLGKPRKVQKPLLTASGSTRKFRSHCSRDREATGSSEAIAHGIGKHREVQKPLLTGSGSTGKFRSHCSRDREAT